MMQMNIAIVMIPCIWHAWYDMMNGLNVLCDGGAIDFDVISARQVCDDENEFPWYRQADDDDIAMMADAIK